MPYYVIGDDKGFEQAYSSEEVDILVGQVVVAVNNAQGNINTLQKQLNTTNTNVNAKQNKITSGTAAPSGGSNGDIYIQY